MPGADIRDRLAQHRRGAAKYVEPATEVAALDNAPPVFRPDALALEQREYFELQFASWGALMLTLQSIIVIAVGWSAIYWQWTDTRLATIIGFLVAYAATLAVLSVRDRGGVR